MLTPAEFYLNHYDASDPCYVVPGAIRRHLGSDFNGLPEGTEIPSWCTGSVTANGWSSVIGWYLIIRTIHGGWAGFYHLKSKSPLGVGAAVSYGQFIGQLGNTGTASIGAHLHCLWSTRDGSPGTGDVDDPWTAIKVVIAFYTNPIEIEEIEMSQPHYICFTGTDPDQYALISVEIEGGYKRSTVLEDGEAFSYIAANGAPVYCKTQAQFDNTLKLAAQLRNEYLSSQGRVEVGSVIIDNTEVLKRLDALPVAIAVAFFAEQKKAGN